MCQWVCVPGLGGASSSPWTRLSPPESLSHPSSCSPAPPPNRPSSPLPSSAKFSNSSNLCQQPKACPVWAHLVQWAHISAVVQCFFYASELQYWCELHIITAHQETELLHRVQGILCAAILSTGSVFSTERTPAFRLRHKQSSLNSHIRQEDPF